MTLQNDEQSRVLVDSQAHILNHAFSFVKPMSLKCAIQLQIPDIINRHGAPMSLEELVNALPINKKRSQHVYRLMNILVHSGFFVVQSIPSTEDENREGYLLTPASRLLLKDDPFNISPLLLSTWDPILMEPYQHMSEWFQNGDDLNPFETTYGKALWEVASHEPKLNRSIKEAMASDGSLVATVILKHCEDVFKGLDSIVDVAGGTGSLAKCIAEAYPNMNC